MWQGYWLSRDHFGPFVMASGMGIPFEPPQEMLGQAMEAVAQNPDDSITLPENMAPLQAVFRSGSPDLLNDPTAFDPLDFEGLRLDPATFDETVGLRGQAETMLKETQWAHNFADPHFGSPDSDFGAQQRFIGVMVNLLATMQGQFTLEELAGDDGLYVDEDGSLDYTANWVLLHAFSDLALLLGGDVAPYYANQDAAPTFDAAADELMEALADRVPEDAREAAAAVRALAYRASTSEDPEVHDRALERIDTIADELDAADSSDPTQAGATLAALVSAAEALGDDGLRSDAGDLFQTLREDFDADHGVFTTQQRYSVDDVAWILGGLNSVTLAGPEDLRGSAASTLLAFHDATLGVAGMQLSAPPGKNGAMAGDFEKTLPTEAYYRPANTPPPPAAGALTMPAAEITWDPDGESWEVSDRTLATGGAMHLANELNWYGPHLGSVPFPLAEPEVDHQNVAEADEDGKLTVVARDIAFSVSRIELNAGEEITIAHENRDLGIDHNFHVFGDAIDSFRTEIEQGPVEQELVVRIDEPGTYQFVCDVHPTMIGEVVVTDG